MLFSKQRKHCRLVIPSTQHDWAILYLLGRSVRWGSGLWERIMLGMPNGSYLRGYSSWLVVGFSGSTSPHEALDGFFDVSWSSAFLLMVSQFEVVCTFQCCANIKLQGVLAIIKQNTSSTLHVIGKVVGKASTARLVAHARTAPKFSQWVQVFCEKIPMKTHENSKNKPRRPFKLPQKNNKTTQNKQQTTLEMPSKGTNRKDIFVKRKSFLRSPWALRCDA